MLLTFARWIRSLLQLLDLIKVRIVDEAFKTAGVNEVDELLYWLNKCVERLIRGKPFCVSTIGEYKGRKSVRKYVGLAVKLHVDIPAPQLISRIVLLTTSQVRMATDRFLSQNPLFFRFLGGFDVPQWLPPATRLVAAWNLDTILSPPAVSTANEEVDPDIFQQPELISQA